MFQKKVVNLTRNELALLCFDRISVEVGVAEGLFSRVLLGYNPKKLYLVDPYKYDEDPAYKADINNVSNDVHEDRYLAVKDYFKEDKRVEMIRHTSCDARRLFDFDDTEKPDFLYIDAKHDYKSVKGDLSHWYSILQDGGYLCGHDYTTDDCNQGFGVVQAVDEFAQEHDLDLLITNERWPSYIMRKPL